MKYIFLGLVVLFFLSPARVLADYSRAYADYQYQFSLYSQGYDKFQIAKSTFGTYKTLTTKNEAMEAMRQVLSRRNLVIISFLQLILEKLMATEGVPTFEIATYDKIFASQSQFLLDMSKKIENASTIDDLNELSEGIEERYKEIDREAKEAIGKILLAKISRKASKADDLFSRTQALLGSFGTEYKEAASLSRSLTFARVKYDLYANSYRSATANFTFKGINNNQEIDLGSGVTDLLSAKQYLVETASYLLDLLWTIPEYL